MMTDCFFYAMKVMLFHSICYGAYWTLLRTSRYFTLNRAYLLCTLILGLVAPAIMLPAIVFPAEPLIYDVSISAGTFSEVGRHAVTNSSIQYVGEHSLVFNIIYLAGVVILTLRSALSVMLIRHIKARGVEEPHTTPKVFTIKEAMSFSFINTIILQQSAGPAVFLHEKGHVAGKHWVDLIFMEMVCIVCWMNPIVWLYKRSLKQQHEYLADDYVLRHGVSQENYLRCIFDSLSCQELIGPVHKFNSQSLKQRISMMTKDQFLPYAKVVYIGIVLLVALLFLSFSGKKSQEGSIDAGKVFVIDAAHGGNDAGSISASGVPEKQISLNLARFVLEIGKEKGLNILLTRTSDQQLSLQERVDFAAEAKADVFLSLHFGFEPEGMQKGAGMYISEENRKFTDSKRIAAVLTKELDDINELGSPQVRNSNAFVLKHNHAASAILELGYFSDEKDAKFISDPMNQRRIAEKIVSALIKY